ncbi:twin-arginine translocase subunit TatC [Pseudaeromonas sp. ZJS20]|uniref:twin-arginine translocase subunit TatC n=1 Tax=Pseudaeromonas aegiceratis TaxID=3153928 RepID=UPI00390C4544
MSETRMPEGDARLGLLEHLLELRRRVIRAVLALVAVTVCLLPFMEPIFEFFSRPLLAILPGDGKMLAIGVISPVMVPLKLTLFVALILALPFIFYQIWSFVAPGLYRREKRLLLPAITFSFLLFLLGVAYCYFIVFGLIFSFIAGYAPESVQFAPDIDAYIGFILRMFLAFGLTFEVPAVVLFVHLTGLVSLDRLVSLRRYVIALAFVLAAIVTPPDVVSQFMLALPIIVLYELGLGLARLLMPRRVLAEPEPR